MTRRRLRCSPAVRRPVAKRTQRTGGLTQSRPDAVGQEGLNEQRETGLSGFELRRDGSPCLAEGGHLLFRCTRVRSPRTRQKNACQVWQAFFVPRGAWPGAPISGWSLR